MSIVPDPESTVPNPSDADSFVVTDSVDTLVVASKSVRQEIEILRILSAFGIVWFHNGRDAYGIGYGGLVVFLVLSTFFGASKSGGTTGVLQILSKRSMRLLLPWAVWMLAYGIQNHFINRDYIETDRGWFNGVLAGTRIHLWYLPYIFAVGVGLDLIAGRVPKAVLGWVCGIGAVATLSTSTIWRPWAEGHGYPTVQYCHGVAGILIGVFLATRKSFKSAVFYALLAGIVGTEIWATWRHIDGVGSSYLVGTLACALALLPSRSWLPKWLDVTSISDCMFGVYLCHIFYLRLFEDWEKIPSWAEAYLTFAAGLVSIWLFRQFLPKIARFVV